MRSGWTGSKDRWVIEGAVGPRWAFLSSHTWEPEAFEQLALYEEIYTGQKFRMVYERTTRTVVEDGTEPSIIKEKP